MRMKDLTGQRFGRLVALYPTEKRLNGNVVWQCQCDCGNLVKVRTASLGNGNTRSCGCITKEISHELGETMQKRFSETEYIDNTNLCRLTAKAPTSNTSGRKGVMFHKRVGKWTASITIRKRRYHLGYYSKFEDAVKARERAEEELFEPTLNKYGRTLYNNEISNEGEI